MKNGDVEKTAFSLVNCPDRANWPVHGVFMSRQGYRSDVISLPIFSLETAITIIKRLLILGVIDMPNALLLETQIGYLDLPEYTTRFDVLVSASMQRCNDLESARKMCHRFINIVSGAVPPEEGSGDDTRFEYCENGEFCESLHCHLYPPHGAVLLSKFSSDIRSAVSFSAKYVHRCIEDVLRTGLTVQDDIAQTNLDRLITNESTERASRLVKHHGVDVQDDMLDIIFGILKQPEPVHAYPCGDHIHVRFPIFGDSSPICDRMEANKFIQTVFQTGAISLDEAINLRGQLGDILPLKNQT